MLKPKEISEKTFDKTLGFGYRMDDVDSYLKDVSDSMSELMEKNEELQKKLEILADKLTEYREDEESLRTAILSSQKLGDSLIREAKTKSEIIMRDATIKAEAMVNNAKRQIERENEGLERLQREVASFKNRLFALYRQHIEIVSALPGEIEEDNSLSQKKQEPAEPVTAPAPEHIPEQQALHLEPVEPAYPTPQIVEPKPEEEQLDLMTEQAHYDEKDELDDDYALTEEDEEDEEDEDNPFLLFKKTMPSLTKDQEMRFGEAFKIKRDSSFPKFKK